jgi:hypothetical protein
VRYTAKHIVLLTASNICVDTFPLKVQSVQHMRAYYRYVSLDTHIAGKHSKRRSPNAAFCNASSVEQVHHGRILVCNTELRNLI